MKVKLIHPINGPEGTYKTGDMPDLSESLARRLTLDGHAILQDEAAPAGRIAPARKKGRK